MYTLRILLPVAVSLGISATTLVASASVRNTMEAKNASEPTVTAKVPAAADAEAAVPKKSHTFRVSDEKGPLLTCFAPTIDTDTNTDHFEDCTLAPGRTLDDVMHTFVGAIHYEQNQHAQERAEWMKQLEGKEEKTKTASK